MSESAQAKISLTAIHAKMRLCSWPVIILVIFFFETVFENSSSYPLFSRRCLKMASANRVFVFVFFLGFFFFCCFVCLFFVVFFETVFEKSSIRNIAGELLTIFFIK